MDEIKQIVAGETEGVLTEVYKDLLSPTVKPVGAMLSLLPRTIRLALGKWEKWIINGEESLQLTAQALRIKVENIPEDKLCEPEPYIAVPAIQQIAYCYNSEVLRDMYANLLASSMNVEEKWKVHPSFVDIIKQMTPDEAKLLKVMPRSSKVYLPVVDLKKSSDDNGGTITIERNIVQDFLYDVCESPKNMSTYLENLERLKLIKIPEDQFIVEETYYIQIEESTRMNALKSSVLPEGKKYITGRRLLYVTDYGLSFIRCCIDG